MDSVCTMSVRNAPGCVGGKKPDTFTVWRVFARLLVCVGVLDAWVLELLCAKAMDETSMAIGSAASARMEFE